MKNSILITLLMFSFSIFAVDQIDSVNVGDKITAAKINELINELNTSGIKQVVQTSFGGTAVYSLSTDRANPTRISDLDISLLTKKDNSNVLYTLNMAYECHHDVAFFLERSIDGGAWVEIGGHTDNPGFRLNGMFTSEFDGGNGNVDSTLITNSIEFLDELNVPKGSTVSYRLNAYTDVASRDLYLNRTLADTTVATERASSRTLLKEIAK